MTDEYQKVLANPRSIRARRVLLRAWEERGELRAELLRLALDQDNSNSRELAARLMHARGNELAGPIAAHVEHVSFGKGLVCGVTVNGEQFVARSTELTQLAPLISILIKNPSSRPLIVLPALRQFVRLSFSGDGVDDDLALQIAESEQLASVRVMRLTNGSITGRGLDALATSTSLPNLITVELTGNPCESQVQRVGDNAYYLGSASASYWDKARDDQFYSSDSFNPANFSWPPTFDDYAWTE